MPPISSIRTTSRCCDGPTPCGTRSSRARDARSSIGRASWWPVEASVLAQLRAAERAGVEIHAEEAAVAWRSDEREVRVETRAGSYTAERLVLTTGAWMAPLFRSRGVGFEILRKRAFWLEAGAGLDVSRPTPCYLFELGDGVFYGFPRLDGKTVKLAEHSGGELLASADDRDRIDSPAHRAAADEDLVRKFAPVVGEILGELATEGRTRHPIGFLGLARFGVRSVPV